MVVVITASRMPSGISLPPRDTRIGRIGHQVADVAHEQQRAAVQRERARRRRSGVLAVGLQAAREGLAALGDFLGQRALQDAEPVAVGQHLVLGVDRGDRILAGPGWWTAPLRA